MKAKKIWTALAMTGLLMAGCQSAPSGAEGGTPPAPMATSGASPAPASASIASGEDALKAMREAMNKATSWRATTVMGGKVNNVLDNVCPNKSRMVSGDGSSETIRIGPDTYSKVGKHPWVKTATKSMGLECGPERIKEPPASMKVNITKGGTATVNGESCQEWTTSIEGKPPEFTTTACVGSDNLPRQMKIGDVIVTYSNWNKPATIEAPK